MPVTSTPTLLAQSLHTALTAPFLCASSQQELPAPLAGAILREAIAASLPEGVSMKRGYIQTDKGCSMLIEGILQKGESQHVGDISLVKPENVLGIIVPLSGTEQIRDLAELSANWKDMGSKAPIWGMSTAEPSAGKSYLQALQQAGGENNLAGICLGNTGFIRPIPTGWELGKWNTDNKPEQHPAYQALTDAIMAWAKGNTQFSVSFSDNTFQVISQSSPQQKVTPAGKTPKPISVSRKPNGQAGQAMATAPVPTPPAQEQRRQQVIQPEIFTPDEEGYYPLHRAVMAKKKSEVSSLLSKGAITEVKDKDGCTPLHKAIQLGEESLTELLLKQGASPNSRNYLAATALHMAVELRKPELVATLITFGAEIEARNNRGKTALHIAAANGCLACARVLIEKGANLASTMERDMQPLHLAAWYGQQDLAEFLIQQGAGINATNADGNAALHFAAFNGQVKLIKVLINMRADMFLENAAGETYLQGINEGYQGEMIAVLS